MKNTYNYVDKIVRIFIIVVFSREKGWYYELCGGFMGVSELKDKKKGPQRAAARLLKIQTGIDLTDDLDRLQHVDIEMEKRHYVYLELLNSDTLPLMEENVMPCKSNATGGVLDFYLQFNSKDIKLVCLKKIQKP
eukprot:UN15170